MATFKPGDGVIIKTREVTPEDTKSGLYYRYFGGLTGTVDKVYDDGTVCVNIDIDSLSSDARDRHLAMQESERKRWLDGLSGEARNRLTEEQRRLKISYKILVSMNDLESFKGGKPKGESSAKAEAAESSPESDRKGPARAPDPGQAAPAVNEEPVKRLSEADLAAKEEEFLRSLQDRQ